MANLNELFEKDYARNIETVIKADDQEHIFQEVDEYVITSDLTKSLANFFEAYNDKSSRNGVWISGFFGCGKSHLLKILSHALENKSINGYHLGDLFATKAIGDAKLKADISKAIRTYKSESILFNIDQQSQITAKTDYNAILHVFYKVFYDHQGFYGFQPHVAEFEMFLSKEGKYEEFKTAFNNNYTKIWEEARKDYVHPRINDAIAKACGIIYNDDDIKKYDDYLDKRENIQKVSIEDFALKVSDYINSKGENFRLNFFVDEVGQYIAEDTKLMLNLQTIAESLYTKCNGNSWVIVTSQEDLESLVGDDKGIQSDDFSKIQGRFNVRMPLTSSNVDEVIEKRLLLKNEKGKSILSSLFKNENENLKTLLSFSEAGIQFRGYDDSNDFVNKYPFIPYQFDLFQQCIIALSKHNVFQGKHQSVGERSMLGVFQEVLKNANFTNTDSIVSFDKMFEGIRASLRVESQSLILLAEKQLRDETLAIRVLKVLFLIKYYESFKATSKNISVLLLDSLKTNPVKHHKEVEVALNLLEQQTYIQFKGDIYEYLTNDEKDIENEIKETPIDNSQIGALLNEIIFDGIIRETKIKYSANNQDFEYSRRVDGSLFGKDKELKIEIITPNSENYHNDSYYTGTTTGDTTLMIVKLPEDKRLIYDARLSIKTDKYIKQNQSTSNNDNKKRIMYDKGQQNRERKRIIENGLNNLLATSTIYIQGSEYIGTKSSDGRIVIVDAFQSLIQRAYPKLNLLGSVTTDENQIKLIMTKFQPKLFGGDETNLSSAEEEVFNLIVRRKNQDDRISLNDIKDHFSKTPYGWSVNAVWSVIALIFKRGKIEARLNTNLLEDGGFSDALNSNRLWATTLIVPQIEFGINQINKLKEVFQHLFNETNPYNEAKEVAAFFKEKAQSEVVKIGDMLVMSNQYKFLKSLEPLAKLLDKLSKMDYASLITTIDKYEDELLDAKEDYLDPILQFWNGEQKRIFDRVLTFQNGNQSNFDYIDADEKDTLAKVQEDASPYKGSIMKQAKEAMDILEKRIKSKIEEEQNLTIDEANNKIAQLKNEPSFKDIKPLEQEDLLRPFEEAINKAKAQHFIAHLILERQKLGETFTDQLNALAKIIAKKDNKGETTTQPIKQFINIKEVEKLIVVSSNQLNDEGDVDHYIQMLKTAMMKQINNNRKITLN